MNSFGHQYRITSFGESHGPAIGGVIDGIEPGLPIDLEEVQRQLARRRPGQSSITTSRKEEDKLEVLSGIFEGMTTGTPIGFIIRNADHHSSDYDNLRDAFRPSHADLAYYAKYGVRDHRGGGRSSARETISRVVAGAFAMQALRRRGISILAYASQVGQIKLNKPYTQLDLAKIEDNIVRCPDSNAANEMIAAIKEAQAAGDTIGGVVTCVVRGMPAGVGSPVFDKLQATLAHAMLSINAAHGFDYGMGFDGVGNRGSEMLDHWKQAEIELPGGRGLKVKAESNHSGGIQGGISNGQDIYFRVAFKPVATLLQDVETVDVHGDATTIHARGRHDPCVIPRAVPIVEAMAAIAIYDALLS